MPRDKALCMSQYAGKEGKDLIKQTVLKTTVAVLGAGLVSYLGTLAVPMLVLLGVMLLDYITGMIKAYIRAELNSKFGIKGILKKLCYMVMVAVGAAVDYLLRGAVIGAGITLDVKLFFGMLVTYDQRAHFRHGKSCCHRRAGVSVFAAHFKAAPSHRGG